MEQKQGIFPELYERFHSILSTLCPVLDLAGSLAGRQIDAFFIVGNQELKKINANPIISFSITKTEQNHAYLIQNDTETVLKILKRDPVLS
jgi:hypothetical protein